MWKNVSFIQSLFPPLTGKDFMGAKIKVELAEKFVPKKMRERGGGRGNFVFHISYTYVHECYWKFYYSLCHMGKGGVLKCNSFGNINLYIEHLVTDVIFLNLMNSISSVESSDCFV